MPDDTPNTGTVTQAPAGPLSFEAGVALLEGRTAPVATPEPGTGAPNQPATPGEPVPDQGQDDAPEATLDPETPGDAEEPPKAPLIEADPAAIAWIDDDGHPVTVEEARKGHLRQSDYTRKTTELAQAREAVVGHEAMLTNAAELAANLLPYLQKARAGELKPIPPMPPPELRTQNVVEYWDQYNAHIAARQEYEAAEQAARALAEATDAIEARRREEWAREQRKLIADAFPEWKDPRTATAQMGEMKSYAKAIGFTDAEIAGVDSRLMRVLRDAVIGAQVRQGGAKGRATQAAAPPKAAPSAPSGVPTGTLTGGAADRARMREVASTAPRRRDRFAAGVAMLAPGGRPSR